MSNKNINTSIKYIIKLIAVLVWAGHKLPVRGEGRDNKTLIISYKRRIPAGHSFFASDVRDVIYINSLKSECGSKYRIIMWPEHLETRAAVHL